ncbi:MAG TPA: cytochrome c oxidase subunit 3 family protein [Thermoanaerobaculia bacterium]|nr:cytochrome c oxidase subunit 3 family protein [Thermoanaerobaculia bacterium]
MSDVVIHTEEHPHHPFLQHHFEDMQQQHEASTLGMWAFLTTEVLFFGGIFLGYTVYRLAYPDAWAAGAHFQNLTYGTLNTIVLLASSLTMALAVHAAQTGKRMKTFWLLAATLVLGSVFLGVKAVEYSLHFEEGLFPGSHFHYHGPLAPQIQLFMTFYFGMTGLHALHMVIGAGLLIWMMVRAWKGHFGEEYYSPVEIMGLYWHFVDLVWIFLFPLLYLIDRHK